MSLPAPPPLTWTVGPVMQAQCGCGWECLRHESYDHARLCIQAHLVSQHAAEFDHAGALRALVLMARADNSYSVKLDRDPE